ncbi:hypothetical protein PROFUN_01976 [Planoprotostelium fungivorum]|uniref:chitinase n=1 Tax=Planoprotostelium fungivorum TaxID=1890364 RepID=A0A2P6NB08_9EUKA|nr:hypothetical protein PROFUN_01976 [Planoprotostelium fungivorum]
MKNTLFIVLAIVFGVSALDAIPAQVVAAPMANNQSAFTGWKNVIYIMQAVDWNNKARSLNVPGHNPVSNGYNIMVLAFYDSVHGAGEMAQTWAQLSDGDRNSYLNAYHQAGKKVIVSLFGGADSNPSRLNPNDFANKVVNWVKKYKLDGVDVDYEDEKSFSKGTGAQWVISLTKTLRNGLPHGQYLLTHAPQAPHFAYGTFKDNAYITIHKAVGDLIDWYSVQFYNNDGYENCNDLMFHRNGYGSKSSTMEIISNIGVPAHKLVVGKPVGTKSRHDADNGFMDINTLVGCIKQARGKGYTNGGIMGWELFYDNNGNWGNTAPNAWK